ncbi:hypothetical protein EBO34_19735 [Alteribacter keqinensis]|uniref:Uncharacterized protein n=1 Tax=Alteribacter keqinensis TaxID=2483800 RepID=A0A3M7TLD1_9BACI|nr:hypothetical protein EBO34_19735 [Alteribacter keqinensis]
MKKATFFVGKIQDPGAQGGTYGSPDEHRRKNSRFFSMVVCCRQMNRQAQPGDYTVFFQKNLAKKPIYIN